MVIKDDDWLKILPCLNSYRCLSRMDNHIKVAGYPIGLFPAIDSNDPEWNFRIDHLGHLLGDLAEETVHNVTRFMNVQHHYQILLLCGMG
jgi:hypothetical protein